MSQTKSDLIYSSPHSKIKDFTFDAQVVDVFPDMIKRSVPGYTTIIETIGQLSERYVTDNSNVYDLGCSLGAATLAMRQNITADNCQIYALDNSAAMVERCSAHVNSFKSNTPCQVLEQDILTCKIENASMVVLNFTLQFLDPEQRKQLLLNIANGLNKNGILVLSEKISVPDDTANSILGDLHIQFKRTNGYSELEIAQKRTALENVMRIDDINTHTKRLSDSGFHHITPWFQCFNFMSMVAVK